MNVSFSIVPKHVTKTPGASIHLHKSPPHTPNGSWRGDLMVDAEFNVKLLRSPSREQRFFHLPKKNDNGQKPNYGRSKILKKIPCTSINEYPSVVPSIHELASKQSQKHLD